MANTNILNEIIRIETNVADSYDALGKYGVTKQSTDTLAQLATRIMQIAAVLLTGDQTVGGAKTFTSNVTAPAFYASSDERLKDNVKSIDSDDNIPNLVEFNWKNSGMKSYGVIAQELEKNYPELVSTDENGFKKVNYPATLSLIVGKLCNRIDKLEQRMNTYECYNK